MNPQEPILLRSARWLTFGSAAAIMLGIAPSQILLALSFAALLACGEKLRLPRIRLPLALFMLGTVISLLLSDDLNRAFSDSAGALLCRAAGLRRKVALAAHPVASRALHAWNRDLPVVVGRSCRRTSANSQILRLPRVAGGVFAPAQPGDGPQPLPHLGGHRCAHRHPRMHPVCRQSAGGASPRPQF